MTQGADGYRTPAKGLALAAVVRDLAAEFRRLKATPCGRDSATGTVFWQTSNVPHGVSTGVLIGMILGPSVERELGQ